MWESRTARRCLCGQLPLLHHSHRTCRTHNSSCEVEDSRKPIQHRHSHPWYGLDEDAHESDERIEQSESADESAVLNRGDQTETLAVWGVF